MYDQNQGIAELLIQATPLFHVKGFDSHLVYLQSRHQ